MADGVGPVGEEGRREGQATAPGMPGEEGSRCVLWGGDRLLGGRPLGLGHADLHALGRGLL